MTAFTAIILVNDTKSSFSASVSERKMSDEASGANMNSPTANGNDTQNVSLSDFATSFFAPEISPFSASGAIFGTLAAARP